MMHAPHKDPSAEVTVWYDSECPICIREIRLVRRFDKRNAIQFVEIQSATGCPISTDALMERFHAQEFGQPIVSGAAAFAAMVCNMQKDRDTAITLERASNEGEIWRMTG